ncbi:MAG: Tat (Twin-arginine translocation) pathway signal sequence domain protein, partial [Frankiales bacterium]|nr:Tat (Twin-arginine translocation) pathway signal sequence domain protein [Frankiales bacterium]
LLGALAGSGYDGGTFLVRRHGGHTVQLTPLLYGLLEQVDGERGVEALAARLSDAIDRGVGPGHVTVLLDKLADLGLLSGTEPEHAPVSNPLLALRWKFVVSNPRVTRRLTAPFAALFSPLLMWPVLACFVAVCWFVLVDKGLASATHSAFNTPGLLLGVFALAVLSAGFHELGHAAACRYGGAQPGAMGAGIYLVWPAFYTNVDDAYRLDRKGRLRVDLAGLYFNALVAVAVTALWLATGVDALLLGVATQLLQMLHQLTPVLRADGYHILADWTGVPDLYAHLGPTLRRVLPWHWGTPSPLTRKARWIVTGWVALVVPVLASLLLTAVLVFPRLVATAWSSGRVQGTKLGQAAEQADLLGMGADLLRLLALLLPVLGTAFLLSRLVRRTTTRTWQRTSGRPVARSFAVLAGALVVALLAWAWWPSGQYQPVRGTERGTVPSLFQSVSHAAPSAAPQRQLALAMVPRGAAAADHPVLLLTKSQDGLRTVLTTTAGGRGHALPFALPGKTRPGETRALAVNTKDGSVVYDIAYALVTITDGSPVTNVNDAWALASCKACTTVAVSFQVVLVIGQSNVVTPVNAAVAANGNCVRCLTTAMAVQLVVTLKSAPSAAIQAQLTHALAGLDALKGLDPAQLVAAVTAAQNNVLTTLVDAGLVDGVTATTATASASASASASAPASPAAVPSQAAPTGSGAPSAAADTGPTPSTTTSPPPSSAPSSEAPTPTASPSS